MYSFYLAPYLDFVDLDLPIAKQIYGRAKGIVFFFPGKVRWPFIHSNPKIVFFFSENAEKKKQVDFLSFPENFRKFFCFFFLLAETFVGHSFI